MLSKLLNGVIAFALHQRVLVAALALFSMAYGSWQIVGLDRRFPRSESPAGDRDTEAPGLAPEEVEALITFPLESAINGATGVEAVANAVRDRSVGHVRRIRLGNGPLQGARSRRRTARAGDQRLPENVSPQLAPISSIMGQIIMIGMWSEGQKTSPMQLRTLADWVVRQRLLTINGVSQVFVMGGERMQYQVLVNPHELLRYGVSVREVETALAESNENATGGNLQEQGPNEYLVRSLGRIRTVEDLKNVIVATRDGRPVLISQIARVIKSAQVKRGDSTAFVRAKSRELRAESGERRAERRERSADETDTTARQSLALRSPPSALRSPSALPFSGGPAVLLTINKQPNADTRRVTEQVTKALRKLTSSLPPDVRLHPEMYQQREFIDREVHNVIEACAMAVFSW